MMMLTKSRFIVISLLTKIAELPIKNKHRIYWVGFTNMNLIKFDLVIMNDQLNAIYSLLNNYDYIKILDKKKGVYPSMCCLKLHINKVNSFNTSKQFNIQGLVLARKYNLIELDEYRACLSLISHD